MDLAEIIVRRLGIDPVELRAAFTTFLENVAETNREVKAAKAGVGIAWRELDARTQRIEMALTLIVRELGLEARMRTAWPVNNNPLKVDKGTLNGG